MLDTKIARLIEDSKTLNRFLERYDYAIRDRVFTGDEVFRNIRTICE